MAYILIDLAYKEPPPHFPTSTVPSHHLDWLGWGHLPSLDLPPAGSAMFFLGWHAHTDIWGGLRSATNHTASGPWG